MNLAGFLQVIFLLSALSVLHPASPSGGNSAPIPWKMQLGWFSMPEHRIYCIYCPCPVQSLDGRTGAQSKPETTFPFNEQCWMALEFPWEFCWNEPAWFVRRKCIFPSASVPFPAEQIWPSPGKGALLDLVITHVLP